MTNVKLDLKPVLNDGEYVFCSITDLKKININDIVFLFRESEAYSIIVKKELANSLNLEYSFVASWITLSVNTSLEDTGITAAFSTALANAGISCNVIAAVNHDHIFVNKNDAEKAIEIIKSI